MRFPTLCKQLREARGLKQREVAAVVGLKTNSYGNVESNNHKTLDEKKVLKLAAFYELDETATADLVAAWRDLPVSAYNQRNRPSWERRKALRSAADERDAFRIACVNLATLLTTNVPDPDQLCTCRAPDDDWGAPADREPCELCDALQLLGLPRWTTLDDVVAKLAAVQEALQ